MIEILTIEQVKKGDILLIDGFHGGEVSIITVEDTDIENYSITPVGYKQLIFFPEFTNNIIKIGSTKEEPVLSLLTQDIDLKLTTAWQTIISK